MKTRQELTTTPENAAMLLKTRQGLNYGKQQQAWRQAINTTTAATYITANGKWRQATGSKLMQPATNG